MDGLENSIEQILWSRFVQDFLPSIILPIIIFFLTWAILNNLKIKKSLKIITLIIITILSIFLTEFLIFAIQLGTLLGDKILQIYLWSIPSIIVYTIPLVIALFPLVVLTNNKKYFYIFLLAIFMIGSILEASNLFFLIFPLSIISLLHNYRKPILNKIRPVLIIFTVVIIIIFVLIILFNLPNTYRIVKMLVNIKIGYAILFIWVILWSILFFYLKKSKLFK